ncbi:MAG: hypothetical protein A2583_09830 [Bdellovibrionales bacterium RIFOXYD1_FULL_53_11]|nr:MAG: hypothetical protein A2583_09830 [Bdellovibrionales bacterium RIFOXYD1_FULL_53_11]
MNMKIFISTGIMAGALAMMSACTGQLPGSFRLAQVEQTFSAQLEVNTKIDLLWVVDNSASMDISQQKLRSGFSAFANKYMQPTWDIRIAVITTDMYMAGSGFSGYLGRTIPSTTGWKSNYIYSRIGTFVNPAWNPSLVNLATGRFDGGLKYGELIPLWGPDYARLLAGYHDGPITALCVELMPYFLSGVTSCQIRDNQAAYSGTSHCLSPDTDAGETSASQCVNTVQNDTVRSGKAIISTMPPAGTAGDSAWKQQLINDFMINATTGSAGQGSERGLSSVLQLISDNEGTATSFFRAGSARGIIFVTDEDDQSMTVPAEPDDDFKPQSYYKCDQASLVGLNGADEITGINGYCCSEEANNCTYGSEGTSCPSKTVDGYTYTPSLCPRDDKLIVVSSVKEQLDAFFSALDDGGSANYFVASIVPLTAVAIQDMQTARTAGDAAVGAIKTHAVDRGDRYLELGALVGNGSLQLDISASDYSPILDEIGRAIIAKKSTFTLARAPTSSEDMLVNVIHANGTIEWIPSTKYAISGKTLVITDTDLVLSFAATDKVSINYQPKSVN